MSLKIKRPNYLSQQFSPIVTLRLGEWRYLLKLVQRNLVARHKETFLFYLWTSSLFFFFGSIKSCENVIKELTFKQEVSFLIDYSNFSKKIFTISKIPFFLKGGNSFLFFDYLSKSWSLLFTELISLSNSSTHLELFDLIQITNILLPFSTSNLLLCFDLAYFRFFLFFRFYSILKLFLFMFIKVFFFLTNCHLSLLYFVSSKFLIN